MAGASFRMASLELFANITRTFIADGEFEEFLPTVLYPDRKQLGALEGVPPEADIEKIAVTWAASGALAEDEEFLVAFRINCTQFKIVRRINKEFEQGTFQAKADDSSS